MANLSKNYKDLYEEASNANDVSKMKTIFTELMDEIGGQDDPAKIIAERQNSVLRNEAGKKV